MNDRWAAASSYEAYMGRWSRVLAPAFVAWLDAPAGARWLDVGCGTGALTDAICDLARPASVVGCDPSSEFIEFAKSQSHRAFASFAVAGAGELPSGGGYNCVVSMLALNFMPDPVLAVKEMCALTTPPATVAACVWDYAAGMTMLRRFWDAARAIDPRAELLDEGVRFPLCQPGALESLFIEAGLRGVRCEALEISTPFRSFDDYWQPFLGAAGPAPGFVASLDDGRRDALRRALVKALLPGPDGAIHMPARAWAVRGEC